MNRRTFLQLTGTAVTTGLGSRRGIAEPDPDTAALLSLLEDAPRGRLPAELVTLIGSGLRHETLLEARSLAAVRNVQPYPDVGFKFHSMAYLPGPVPARPNAAVGEAVERLRG